MAEEHRPRVYWTDELLNLRFAGLDVNVADVKKQLREQIEDLKKDFDQKHEDNQENSRMLSDGQAAIQECLSLINEKQSKSLTLLTQVVGDDGKPEEGRLGRVEKTVEMLKEFRWQVIAFAVALGAVLDHFFKLSSWIPKLF